MKRRTKRGLDWLGGLMIAGALAAIATAALLAQQLQPPARDPETLCARDASPAAHVVILIDATDALEPRHRRLATAAVESERARLKTGDRLTLATLSDRDPREPTILFSKCDPGDGGDANPWFQNGAQLDQRWREEFGEPLDAALARAVKGRKAKASPLVEAIGALAREPTFAATSARRLTIVSDMMENQPGVFSLYAAGATFASFRGGVAGVRPPPDLADVNVRIVQLDRPDRDARQLEARTEFWGPYFDATGAAALAWEP